MEYPKECTCKEAMILWDYLCSANWKIHHAHGQSYLLPSEYNKQRNNLSKLRSMNQISIDHRLGIKSILDLGLRHYYELKAYMYNAPRREAQKFIGKKNIRRFIFKRDGFMCLKCNSNYKLSLDHIVPINKGGLNRLYNLQTLCMPCNSSKGTKIIDYR